MRIKLPTISIGIPAFNESENIGMLLSDIKKQKIQNFRVKEIIVSSDGSTDKTNSIVKKFKKIKLFANQDRKGLSRGLNQIIEHVDSDILVIFNADIRLPDMYTISKLANQILYGNDLVSCPIIDEASQSFISKSLSVSMTIKEKIFSSLRSGVNPYSCRGPVRAFSKQFYKKLFFPTSVGDDMYSYFACIDKKLKFSSIDTTYVTYKLPETFLDHKKQSTRFFSVRHKMTEYFDTKIIEKELKINPSTVVSTLASMAPFLLKNSIYIACYVCMLALIKIWPKNKNTNFQMWQISESSKSIRKNYV